MPFEFDEQQNEAWNCNDANSIIKRSSCKHSFKVAIAQTSSEDQTTQPRGLTNETTQSPENQTSQTTQPRGLTMPTTK
jgi:hypothetical protein